MILETERLYLREMKQSDYPALCKILQDKDVMYAYEHAFDDIEVQAWLNKVQECIKNGTDINAKNKWGWTALIKASEKGNLDIVEYLIKKEADVNAIDKNNYTALIHASLRGYLKIVKYLVENGADINIETKDGKTVSMYASEYRHTDIVEYLESL